MFSSSHSTIGCWWQQKVFYISDQRGIEKIKTWKNSEFLFQQKIGFFSRMKFGKTISIDQNTSEFECPYWLNLELKKDKENDWKLKSLNKKIIKRTNQGKKVLIVCARRGPRQTCRVLWRSSHFIRRRSKLARKDKCRQVHLHLRTRHDSVCVSWSLHSHVFLSCLSFSVFLITRRGSSGLLSRADQTAQMNDWSRRTNKLPNLSYPIYFIMQTCDTHWMRALVRKKKQPI